MSNLNWAKPEQAYRDGKRLTLYPYEPTRPHGSGEYHRNPLPRDLPYGHIRDFNTKGDFTKTQVEIEIQEIIRRGVNRTSQIFRCSVIKAPEEERPAALQEPLPPSRDENGKVLPGQLAAKVFDYDYYESDFGGPWGNDEEADGNHCREHAVYAYYRRNGKTGYPHIMPQFYGSWVIKIQSGSDENNQPKFRYVGLILIEYIHGYSVENLCLRDRDGDYCSALYPGTLPVGFPNHDGSWLNVTFDVEKRQHVVKEMLHGVVVGMHLGVQHTECEPWNLFVTMRNGLVTLEQPRVVLLDHSYTEVWSLTKYAEAEGDTHCLQKLPYPPHPIERCSIEALDTLEGWWPPTQRQHPGFNDEKFDEWLCKENVFGPHVEAKSVLDPLLGQKKLWPHKYKKYSTFATLDLIEAKEKEVRGAVASKIIQFARENEDMNSDGRQEEREKAIAEGVRRRATFVMTSDSYSLWLRTKVRKLRETKERGLQEAKPREFRETQERERREAKQRKRQEAKARKRQEQERRRQAEAQALSPPPQASTVITLADSSHHNPSRASTTHYTTPAGIENRPPPTRVYSRPMDRETLDHLSRLEEQQVERPIPAVDRPGSGGSPATRRQHRPLSMDANVSPSDPISRPTSSGSPRPQLASITKRPTSSGSPRPALAPVTNRPTSSGSPRPALAPVTNRPTSSRAPQSPLYSEIHLPRRPAPASPSLPLRQRFASPSQMSTVSSSAQPAGQENSPKLPPSDGETSSEDEFPPPWARRR